jgi:predicted N-acetyltransferase YhbS
MEQSTGAQRTDLDQATERVKKGLARHPIPIILLARLAVDVSIHGKGVGSALLKDALQRAAHAADTIGARAFYEHFTFESSPSDPYHLLLIMKDLKQIIDR